MRSNFCRAEIAKVFATGKLHHWHALILEGGFDEEGRFVYLPVSDTTKMRELFRRLVIKLFVEKELMNESFSQNLLSWKHSGFSVDNSIKIHGNDDKSRAGWASPTYSSRTRGIWKRMDYCIRLAPQGWREKYLDNPTDSNQPSTEIPQCPVDQKVQNSTWARLIKRVYGTDSLVCPLCGSEMKILAIIMDPEETEKILKHLVKIGRPPPNFDSASLN